MWGLFSQGFFCQGLFSQGLFFFFPLRGLFRLFRWVSRGSPQGWGQTTEQPKAGNNEGGREGGGSGHGPETKTPGNDPRKSLEKQTWGWERSGDTPGSRDTPWTPRRALGAAVPCPPQRLNPSLEARSCFNDLMTPGARFPCKNHPKSPLCGAGTHPRSHLSTPWPGAPPALPEEPGGAPLPSAECWKTAKPDRYCPKSGSVWVICVDIEPLPGGTRAT